MGAGILLNMERSSTGIAIDLHTSQLSLHNGTFI